VEVGDYTDVHYNQEAPEAAPAPDEAAGGDDAAWAAFIYGAFAIMCILLMGFMVGFGRPKW
jgi:hypothetical protein